jgi:prepilin-type N-terminal cleavage/methylation domain-containing protein
MFERENTSLNHHHAAMTTRSGINSGFSLVELSIVLVILGLLVGGVLTGKSLIRAAELRSIITDQQAFSVAVTTFQEKYQALPGDMTNATKFWGIAAGTGNDAACQAQGTTDGKTCNGNGDGLVGPDGGGLGANERFRFWQHLSNAQLLSGNYTGIAGSLSQAHVLLGENSPTSKISSAGWAFRWLSPTPSDSDRFLGNYPNHFVFGVVEPVIYGWLDNPAISSSEAYSIDKKIDDGKPAQGMLVVSSISGCTNGTSNTDYDSDYLLSNDTIACAFMFFYDEKLQY